jgi:hypothetical protein
MRGLLALMTAAASASAGKATDDGPPRAEPPEASFRVIDGWLHVRVTDAGRPMPGVHVRCLVGATVWASGQTDADGQGAFPRPTGDWCQLVFDLGAGPSAPVPLTFLPDGTAVPVASPVRDGTAACCVMPPGFPRRSPEATGSTDPSFREPLLGLGVGGVACGLTLAAWRRRAARRGPGRPSTNSRRHRR